MVQTPVLAFSFIEASTLKVITPSGIAIFVNLEKESDLVPDGVLVDVIKISIFGHQSVQALLVLVLGIDFRTGQFGFGLEKFRLNSETYYFKEGAVGTS
jgi:hypothetical protein